MNLQTYEIPDNDRPNYFKLKEGENKIRIVSEILDYGSHFVKEEKKSHICLGAEECKYCKAGDRPRTRYMTWVIDRSTGELKLFDFGHSIFKQIHAIARNDDYRFETIPPYDMTIVKKGSGLDTVYSVLAARNDTPITKEEQEKIDDLELVATILNNKIEFERKEIDEIVEPIEENPIQEIDGITI
ncbi:MAG: hypothetical protein BWX56_01409 [Euryarchaeota archaeon ADurb.Bin023]|jgi:hypothetical protein|nr:MAG: hypothetical protein BWX56_01409 [Euryarchaeota archaeon ADurb.Bin023]